MLNNRNPFLEMLAAIGDEDKVEHQQASAGLQQQQQAPRSGKVQLGDFWPQAPNAAAELKFEVAHITSERERFAHTVGARSHGPSGESTVNKPLHGVEGPPGPGPSADVGAEGHQVPKGGGRL